MELSKAKQEAIQALMDTAWKQASNNYDKEGKRGLIGVAHEHSMTHLLPDDAHNMLHEMAVPHKHAGMEENHTHEITKAYNPIGKDFTLTKSWGDDNQTFVEGWLTTPDKDTQGDIIEPESFAKSMDSYFQRRAPVSYIHNRQTLPGGHLQKAAIVRDGKVVQTSQHPSDSADFEHFPGTGTGVYVRGVLTEPEVAKAVKLGNVGGFSFIGNGTKYTQIGKGRHYTEINPWIESTVAPYPINTNAVITVAKAYGLEDETEKQHMSEDIVKALEAILAKAEPAQPVLTEDRLVALLTGFKDEIATATDVKIQKAVDLVREEGIGSKATLVKSELPEDNPLHALVQKAQNDQEWTDGERHLANRVTYEILSKGMNGSATAEIVDVPFTR